MSAITDGSAFVAGLALGSASALSLGPNALMLIREGLARGRVGLVTALVWVSNLSLLGLVLVTASSLRLDTPSLKISLSWVGLAALLWFATASFRSAFRTSRTTERHDGRQECRKACAIRVLKVFWTNPLTYIEIFIVPSAPCGTLDNPALRVHFISGMLAALTTGFCCYSCGGRLFSFLFYHQKTLQFFDFVSGILLSCLALSLAVELVA